MVKLLFKELLNIQIQLAMANFLYLLRNQQTVDGAPFLNYICTLIL